MRTKFEVSGSSHSGDMRGSQNLKVGYVIPPTTAYRLICTFLHSLSALNGVMIGFNATEILRFYHFADSAGKCLFPPFWGVLGDFNPLKLWRHHYNILWYAVSAETRVLRKALLCVKIGLAVSYVGLFKKALRKKVNIYNNIKLLGERQKIIFHPYGEPPPIIRLLPKFIRGFSFRT